MPKQVKMPAQRLKPEAVAARVLDKYLSPDALYWAVLEQVKAGDFAAMENEVIDTFDPTLNTEAEQRAMGRQEVCFLLGVEIGKRMGGAR